MLSSEVMKTWGQIDSKRATARTELSCRAARSNSRYNTIGPCTAVTGITFSSRRRRTRYWRHWSSDVCSSDLVHMVGAQAWRQQIIQRRQHLGWVLDLAALRLGRAGGERHQQGGANAFAGNIANRDRRATFRSTEERRAGKEGRSRWSPHH